MSNVGLTPFGKNKDLDEDQSKAAKEKRRSSRFGMKS